MEWSCDHHKYDACKCHQELRVFGQDKYFFVRVKLHVLVGGVWMANRMHKRNKWLRQGWNLCLKITPSTGYLLK